MSIGRIQSTISAQSTSATSSASFVSKLQALLAPSTPSSVSENSGSSLQLPAGEPPIAQALLAFVEALLQKVESNPSAFSGLTNTLSGGAGGSAASVATGAQSTGSALFSTAGSTASFAATSSATSINSAATSINSAAGGSFKGDLPTQDAPATYNASTHAAVVANTPNYDQVAAAVKQQFTTMADPGVPQQMTAAQQQEFIDSTIDCAERYLPSSLPLTQRTALVLADVGAESSFKVGTSGSNGQYGNSVGLQQVTPSIWGSGAGYKGGSQNFDPQSIWGNMHLANWAIASMGSSGGQNGNQVGGSKPATWYTGLYYWSGQAQTSASTLPSTQYRVNQANYLAKVGLPASIMDATW